MYSLLDVTSPKKLRNAMNTLAELAKAEGIYTATTIIVEGTADSYNITIRASDTSANTFPGKGSTVVYAGKQFTGPNGITYYTGDLFTVTGFNFGNIEVDIPGNNTNPLTEYPDNYRAYLKALGTSLKGPVGAQGIQGEQGPQGETPPLTTTITETSTDTEVPSAKAVYDLVGNVEALLTDLNSGTGV